MFEQKLIEGKIGESLIANWLKKKGYNILPIYEKVIKEFKGPVIFTSTNENIIAPDMIVFKKNRIMWIEAKHKPAFTWYRAKKVWNTGIDRKHWKEYLKLRAFIDLPLWLLFLHKGESAKDSPISPAGLFGEEINILKNRICHESNNWGNSGMVYWDINDLKKLAEYEEVNECA